MGEQRMKMVEESTIVMDQEISVIKRDKETVGFQLTKLTASIEKALQAAGNVCSQEISELLSLRKV